MNKIIIVKLSILIVLLLIVGIPTYNFLVGEWIPNKKVDYAHGEVPITRDGVIIADNNCLYLTLTNRIQVYDIDGNYLFNFAVDAGGGVIDIRFNGDNTIEVATIRTNKSCIYDKNGKQLSSKRVEDNYFNIGDWAIKQCISSDKTIYMIKESFFRPKRIVKIITGGNEKTIVALDISTWLFSSGGPLFRLFFICLGLILVLYKIKRK